MVLFESGFWREVGLKSLLNYVINQGFWATVISALVRLQTPGVWAVARPEILTIPMTSLDKLFGRSTMRTIQSALALTTIVLLGTGTAIAQSDYGVSAEQPAAVTNSTGNPTASKIVNINVKGDTAYFTLIMPGRSGQQFNKVSLTEQTLYPGMNAVQFNLSEPAVFLGTSEAMGPAIGSNAWIDETGTLWVEWNSPVAANTPLTVALKLRRQPFAGSYEYATAVYPDTKPAVAVFAGNGTLTVGR
jgi:Protein of unknown function (DUF2808)